MWLKQWMKYTIFYVRGQSQIRGYFCGTPDDVPQKYSLICDCPAPYIHFARSHPRCAWLFIRRTMGKGSRQSITLIVAGSRKMRKIVEEGAPSAAQSNAFIGPT